MRSLRMAKIMMVAGLALYALLVAFGNITDYGSNFAFVQHVLSMDDTFPGNRLMYRAITQPALHHAAYALIIAGEAITGLLLAYGALRLWRARGASATEFAAAKAPVMLGAAAGFLVWFVGFMVIGGEWFAMWQSKIWNGQESAFRIVACFLLVTAFVMQAEEPGRT
jgi:predicted small integral membrane protein